MGAFFSRLLGRQVPVGIGMTVLVAFFAVWLGAIDGSEAIGSTGAVASHLGLRIASVAVLAMATLAASLLLARAWTEAEETRWWDPADRPDGDLDWDRLVRLVHHRHDPLVATGGLRVRTALVGLGLLIPAALALAGVTEELVTFAWRPTLPEALLRAGPERTAADALANLSGNLTAFLTLIAATVSIWFTYSQLRAKVRADNRCEWLGRTRVLLGRVIALGAEHAEAPPKRRARLFSRLDPLRLELELMLNPSEKDHRLLMHLLRRLAFAHDRSRTGRADEGVLVAEIRAACARMGAEHPARYGPDRFEIDWRPVLEADHSALVTYCMRLGHVVLKREWERVKATR